MAPTTDFSQYLGDDVKERADAGLNAAAANGDKTVLQSFVDQAQALVWTPENKDQLATRNNISHYTAEVGKTASLFAKGWAGRAGTVVLFGLDAAKKDDEFPTQALDALLGATKGTAMRGLFGAGERLSFDAPMKGISLGIGSRFIDNMTDRRNYVTPDNSSAGDQFQAAFKTSLSRTFDGGSLLCDAAIFGTSEALMRGVLKPGYSAIGRVLKTSISGGVFGASAGVVGEFQQQSLTGNYDWEKILKSGASHAAVGMAGAGLAGAYNLRLPAAGGERNSKQPAVERERSTAATDLELRPTSTRLAGFDHLALAPRYPANLEGLRNLLSRPTVETVVMKGPLPGHAADAVGSNIEVFRAKLPDVPVDMNVYRPKGLPEIAIPKSYDAELEPVRRLRSTVEESSRSSDSGARDRLAAAELELARHRHGSALLPEELLTAAAQLPEMGSIKRITMLPGLNPEDPFYANKHGSSVFAASEADVSRSGQVTLFQPQRTILDFSPVSPLRNKLIHEWSHLLRWQSGAGQDLYDRVAGLETDKTATPYSRTSPSEDMARNVTQLLHGDPQTMLATARLNPLRSAVIARMIEQSLSNVGSEARSKYHDIYVQRVSAVKALAEPLAQQTLLESIAGSGTTNPGAASRLLIDLGWGQQLSRLGPVERLDLGRTAVTDQDLQQLSGKSISKLDLSSAEGLTGASASAIGSIQGLTEFRAPHTNFGPELLPALSMHPGLRLADLRLTRIPSAQMKTWVAENPQIKVTH